MTDSEQELMVALVLMVTRMGMKSTILQSPLESAQSKYFQTLD